MTKYIKATLFTATILSAMGVMPGIAPQEAQASYIRSALDMSKCLGVTSGNNGARLQLEDCKPSGRDSQQWTYQPRTGLISSIAYPAKCLHKATGGWGRNNPIHLWSCDAGTAEMKTWRVNTRGTINARENAGMCFRLQGGSFTNGAVVNLNGDCGSNSDSINWRLTSGEQMGCGVFDALVRPNLARVQAMINGYLPMEERLNRRKTLVTHRARSVSSSGCNANIVVDATMRRKIRSNAHGTISLAAKLHSVGLNYICLRNPRVTNVNLSHLGRIGENFYRRRGTKGLPDEMCVAF